MGYYQYSNKVIIIEIEIEVVSGTEQIFKNYHKFRKWVHVSSARKGALLHIMTDNTNILQKDMYELLIESYEDTAKGHDFYYG
jgi:hypothetical protein